MKPEDMQIKVKDMLQCKDAMEGIIYPIITCTKLEWEKYKDERKYLSDEEFLESLNEELQAKWDRTNDNLQVGLIASQAAGDSAEAIYMRDLYQGAYMKNNYNYSTAATYMTDLIDRVHNDTAKFTFNSSIWELKYPFMMFYYFISNEIMVKLATGEYHMVRQMDVHLEYKSNY